MPTSNSYTILNRDYIGLLIMTNIAGSRGTPNYTSHDD